MIFSLRESVICCRGLWVLALHGGVLTDRRIGIQPARVPRVLDSAMSVRRTRSRNSSLSNLSVPSTDPYHRQPLFTLLSNGFTTDLTDTASAPRIIAEATSCKHNVPPSIVCAALDL